MNSVIEKKKVFSQDMCGSPYLLLLIVIYVTLILTGFVLSYKLITVNRGLANGALFVAPFWYLIDDVIAEVYGYKISRFLIWLVILSAILFITAITLIIHLHSPAYWHSQTDYNVVFDPLLQMIPAYFFGIGLVPQFVNIFLLTKTKIAFKGRYFWPRSIFTGTIGAFVGILITFSLAYASNNSLDNIEKLILTAYIFHIISATLGGGPALLLVRYLKKKENIDVYDININFNPFKLSLKD